MPPSPSAAAWQHLRRVLVLRCVVAAIGAQLAVGSRLQEAGGEVWVPSWPRFLARAIRAAVPSPRSDVAPEVSSAHEGEGRVADRGARRGRVRDDPGGAAGPGRLASLEEVRARLPEELAVQVLDRLAFRYRLASCTHTTDVTLWRHGGARRRLLGHKLPVTGIQFFPLGDRVITWGKDGAVIVWEVPSGNVLYKLQHPNPVRAVALFPCGRRVAVRSEEGVCNIWRLDAATPRGAPLAPEATVPESAVNVVVFPSGERFLTWEIQRASVWTAAAEAVCVFEGHRRPINYAAVFPGEGRVASCGVDNTAIVWEVPTGKAVLEFRHTEMVVGLAVVGGGSAVATVTSSGVATIWDTEVGGRRAFIDTGTPYGRSPVGPLFTFALVPFPAGDRMVTVSFAEATIWNVTSGRVLHRLEGMPTGFYAVAVSSAGDIVAACAESRVRIWDAESGLPLHELEDEEPQATSASPGTCSVAIGPGGAFDPAGFGRGVPWRGAPWRRAAA